MNDMEKKIKEKGQKRQASLTKEEREGIEKLAKKLTKGAKEAQKKVLEEKGNGKVKKASKKTTSSDKAPESKGFQEKAKKAQPGNEEGLLTTKEVAAMVGTTPKALRRVLRAKWYDDKKVTNYRWTEDDPILQEILDHYATK